jgi:hypothetical protein
VSLADAKALRSALQNYLGVTLPDAEFKGLLEEYEKICQLRHGIVHSDGFLPGRNAVKLEIPRHNTAVRIVIRYRHLQEVADVLSSLVTLLNRHLFYQFSRRWAIDWRKRADWNPKLEDVQFARIWSLFLCRQELATRPGRSRLTRGACISAVRAEFGI